jgi:CubicO group peptidase (beta-lactamase class C family)
MISRYILSLILVFSLFTAILPPAAYAQNGTAQTASAYAKGLATIEEKVEKRRQELGIPGMSLVIVKDGEIIFMKGLGYKDFEKKIPVTPDTQFAIGSATKAFTGLGILMSQDEGKVNLDDSPKKYLSYFKMKDAEADKSMTVRDLLDHSSGLNRTDLAMITERLTRAELIQTVGGAQPMAKLNERFFYNNVMFAAAGEITAKVNNTTWEKYVPERIFKPLGMTNSTMTIPEMKKAKDISFGYEYNFDTKETRRLPFRPIDATNPAGSINSSARDMAKWITFVMNGGTVGGKRLVSEKGFEEWVKVQNDKLTPSKAVNYGLGWFLRDWNGLKVVEHGGNIDGFNALVAMIPEKKLGFVMLTNVSGSPLGSELMPMVWENILGKPDAPKTDNSAKVAPEKEVGKYRFEQTGREIEIKVENGKLTMIGPEPPNFILENVGSRRYKFNTDGADMFITFKDEGMTWETPVQNLTFAKVFPREKEVGKYRFEAAGFDVDVQMKDGKLVAIVPEQPVYELQNVSGRKYKLNGAPDGFFITFKDDSAYLEQPQGNYNLPKAGATAKTSNSESAKELIGKYLAPDGKTAIEVKGETDGKVTFNIEGQQPYSLVEKAKDEFSMSPLPTNYFVKVKRDSMGKVTSVVVSQPEGEFEFKKAEATPDNQPKITVAEIMTKAIEAAGGEANWRKITSRITVAEIDAIHQGVKGTTTIYAKAPNKSASETTMTAVGKTIAKGWDFFDGANGETVYTFMPVSKLTGKGLEDAKLNNDFLSILNWKTNYKTAEVKGMEKVGDEECYVIEFTPEKGTKITEYYSTKTFYLLKRRGVSVSGTSDVTQPYSITLSDYREIDGIKLPFKTVNSTPGMGDIVTLVKSYKHNVAIDDKMFATKKLELK